MEPARFSWKRALNRVHRPEPDLCLRHDRNDLLQAQLYYT